MEKIGLPINSRRVCFGLSRIGYTPTSAICDISDNSVTHGAKNVYIDIVKENEDLGDARINNVKEYLIIDDGDGMDPAGIQDALSLGSDDSGYDEESLSKFGLGLKSAAFAQGNRLEVISATAATNFEKYVVDLDFLKEEDDYFCFREELSAEDQMLITEYLTEGKGTIIRITKIHKNNHPSLKDTKLELEKKLGIIYYYFIKGGVNIHLSGNQVAPYDVLFVEEANEHGNLDESTWDGKTVRWIDRGDELVLDGDNQVTCRIEVTQLPYPPAFKTGEEDRQKEIRAHYNIEAKNYGYYVYRNKRLIAWAEGFNGIIPQSLDLYAFRGRILISSDADDYFNIDVKKSNLVLSREAYTVLDDKSARYKKKSRNAWKNAGRIRSKLLQADPARTANDIADKVMEVDLLPGEPEPTPQQLQERKKELSESIRNRLKKETQRRLRDETGKTPGENELTDQDLQKTVQGESLSTDHIFRSESLLDNVLWEPYYDAVSRGCVRINRNHRFSALVYEENVENADLQVLFDLLLWQMSEAEVYLRTHSKYPAHIVEELLGEYRRVLSEHLSALCRNKDITLPPYPCEL